MSRRRIAAGLGALAAIAVAGVAVPLASTSEEPSVAELNITTVTTTFDADTQYIGKCGIVTPPTPDVCDAVQGTLRYSFFASLVNADNFKKWRTSSPGDYQRLSSHMLSPRCSAAPIGQVQDMVTPLGAALVNVVQAYACALGIEPISWPTPNPPLDPKRADKKAPTAPGPITVTP